MVRPFGSRASHLTTSKTVNVKVQKKKSGEAAKGAGRGKKKSLFDHHIIPPDIKLKNPLKESDFPHKSSLFKVGLFVVEQGTEFRAATVDPHDGEIIKEEKKEAEGGMKKVVSVIFVRNNISGNI